MDADQNETCPRPWPAAVMVDYPVIRDGAHKMSKLSKLTWLITRGLSVSTSCEKEDKEIGNGRC
ncbi:hypothetical protein HJC23_006870 [Cyclotella cryptica]|uniref:Uncharacterized protein n=1 Tax=Cyclotella cryptica TaxID=29204 RepID=A0ABD3QBU9_9STRA